MMKYANLVIVLSLIATISGAALGGLNEVTRETIQNNILKFKKVPAVADIQEGLVGRGTPEERVAIEEALLVERRFLTREGEDDLLFFVVGEGADRAVVLEGFGGGFCGDLGVMVGIDLADGSLAGIGITTMSETPGLGTRVTEPVFRAQFKGMSKDATIAVKKDGGDIDAITGATISSRAVAAAIVDARQTFEANEEGIRDAVK